METGTILIVDDDDNIRELYASAFELDGFAVFKAATGAESINLALEHQPDMILMDITMPDMEGHEAVAAIRKDNSWGRNAKIMYLTNHSDTDNLMKAMEQKSAEYIVKANTDPKDIVARVKKVMYSVS